MPIRILEATDLAACVAALRRVHEASGYPSRWPDDPGGWLTPRGLVAAWVAEHDGVITGHAALISGVRLECLHQATGLAPGELGGIARLYVDPSAGRQGLARALLQTATDSALAHGLQPVLDVVADSRSAIALYEQAGWQLAGTQTATWANPDGTTPVLRCYLRPQPSAQDQAGGKGARLASRADVILRTSCGSCLANGLTVSQAEAPALPIRLTARETGTLAPFAVSYGARNAGRIAQW